MSLRNFIRRTQMLIQHGLHVTRDHGFAGSERPLELTRLEERVLFSASPVAPIAAEVAEAASALMESAGANVTATEPSTNPDSGLFQLSDQQMLDLLADSVLPASQDASQASNAANAAEEETLELVFLDGSSKTSTDESRSDRRERCRSIPQTGIHCPRLIQRRHRSDHVSTFEIQRG